MRLILQSLSDGSMELVEAPAPVAGRGRVLIQTRRSVISPGTERMLLEFGRAGWLQKARSQPDKVRQVLDKARTDGIGATLDAVRRKLDQPLAPGYCNAGVVLEVGEGVHDLCPGDRVASNGGHAEIVAVPRNLCARIPDEVSDDAAAFTVLGSIALQGVRLVQPTLGERFLVFGAGLLGLLTVQLLRASGCEVLAVDLNAERLALAAEFGARTVNPAAGGDVVAAAQAWTGGVGVDGAIITASARGDSIVHEAAQACRKRGRIVLVGVVDLNLRRSDFYEKELTFQVSCSYGPGRYDDRYERDGVDYPLPFVRWTEGRNFEAVLGAMASGALRVDQLITHRYRFDDALEAYASVQNDPRALGVVLEYAATAPRVPRIELQSRPGAAAGEPVVGVIGAGNFAMSTMLPALAAAGARIRCVADPTPAKAQYAARKFGAESAATDHRELLADPAINTLFILSGHHVHAHQVCEGLLAGKHVFVEKPLSMNYAELEGIREALGEAPGRLLMVGFNRRFSPHIEKMRGLLAGRSEPLAMTMTVNAGAIPPDHWTQDPERGGGRIIGEGCHFIDLLAHLAGARIVRVAAVRMGEGPAVRDDKMAIVLGFADGSVGTVNYFANGSRQYPKETLEVFSEGRVLRMENFRVTRGWGFRGFSKFKTSRQDKGHAAEVARFLQCVREGGAPPIAVEELFDVTRASFRAVESAADDEPPAPRAADSIATHATSQV